MPPDQLSALFGGQSKVNANLTTLRTLEMVKKTLDENSSVSLHAHFLSAPDISVQQDGTTWLESKASYLLKTVNEGNAHPSELIFNMTLQSNGSFLPYISEFNVDPLGMCLNGDFQSAYVENRAKSLLHCWLAILDAMNSI